MSGFRGPYLTPTDEQAALVGHIVMDWALVEDNLRHLTRRLAMVPELVGRIVTERMPPSQSVERIKALLKVHAERYCDEIISYDNRLAVEAAMREVDGLRVKRNVFAHHLCIRISDDDIDFFRLDNALPNQADNGKSHNLASLRELSGSIRRAAEALEAAISLIPEQAERLVQAG